MKKCTFGLVAVLFVLGLAFSAIAADDVKAFPSCKYCGMSRDQFSHSRMLIVYDDGTQFGACSLHCAAVDLSINLDKTPKSIHVGDYVTKQLIDAEKAFWVIGGAKPGVMTKRAKWAFEKKTDAEAFVKSNGGNPATFDEAMKASYEDMYSDTKMIREKRKMKRMQMEKKG
ncbi:MAG: NosL [Syntrophorhabdus sp. PtaU1.Bin153]|nr:MAG: NosL [Syntrophorhabdus sp. PtaU1.Bin153]